MSSRTLRAAAVACLLFVGPQVLATVVVAHSVDEMARAAPLIVHATVGGSQVSWDEGHRHIDTFTEVLVTQTLKGSVAAGTALVLRDPGGVVGDRGMHVEGVAHYTRGEEVVLFLEPAADDPRVYLTWAMAAGKVSLRPNALGEKRALRDLTGLSFMRPGSKKPALQAINRPDDLGTPEQFIAHVKQAIGGAR